MTYSNKADQAASARRHYEANREAIITRAAIVRDAAKDRNRAIIREAKNVPCTDCGNKYPYYVMDFDHLGDKEFDISKMVTRCSPVEKLKQEIAKCEVVCSNCHRERTHVRRR